MSDCKIYPADTVDIYGNVWPTVGENIRHSLFGKNMQVGLVNINKGNITSTHFTITDVTTTTFTLNNVNVFLVFPHTIRQGELNITISNSKKYALIGNTKSFSDVIATMIIFYKRAI